MSREKAIYYPVILDIKPKALLIQKQIQEYIWTTLNFTTDIDKANVIFVNGWDWFMLDSVGKYHKHNKIFFWWNCGTLGFLMNEIDNINQLPEYLDQIDHVDEEIIKVEITLASWEKITRYSINDITIWNSLWDMIKFNIQWQQHQYAISWTWLIITTSIWSTWYWLNWWGPLLPLRGNLRWMMWMFARPFKYDTIEAQILEIIPSSRNQVNVWVDGNSGFVDRIEKLKISPSWEFFKLWVQNAWKFENKRVRLCTEKLGTSSVRSKIVK